MICPQCKGPTIVVPVTAKHRPGGSVVMEVCNAGNPFCCWAVDYQPTNQPSLLNAG